MHLRQWTTSTPSPYPQTRFPSYCQARYQCHSTLFPEAAEQNRTNDKKREEKELGLGIIVEGV